MTDINSKIQPGPSAIIRRFEGIIVMMSVSLFYNTAPARECATLFFRKSSVPVEATISFDGVFSSIASTYRVRDDSLRGYCALVESILKLVSANGAIIPEADLDLLAEIVRPHTVFNDEQSRRVTIGRVGTSEGRSGPHPVHHHGIRGTRPRRRRIGAPVRQFNKTE
jgi:hypothetical protein